MPVAVESAESAASAASNGQKFRQSSDGVERRHVVYLRLSAEEIEKIRQAAHAAKKSINVWCREVLLAGAAGELTLEELDAEAEESLNAADSRYGQGCE